MTTTYVTTHDGGVNHVPNFSQNVDVYLCSYRYADVVFIHKGHDKTNTNTLGILEQYSFSRNKTVDISSCLGKPVVTVAVFPHALRINWRLPSDPINVTVGNIFFFLSNKMSTTCYATMVVYIPCLKSVTYESI